MDVAPTVLDLMGIEPPHDMVGRHVLEASERRAYTEGEEEQIRRKLEELGYL